MLHVVWKIRSVVRRPHWEKKIMKQFGLEKVRSVEEHHENASLKTGKMC